MDVVLSNAASMLEGGSFAQAAAWLQKPRWQACNYRINLLLAAAYDGEGNIPAAEQTLQRAHTVWPSNTSIAASLARYYLRDGQFAGAAAVASRCRPTASTPLRELQTIAFAFLENQDLTRAESIAILAYRSDPSEDTLLFAANILQLQGRDMDVVSMLRKFRHEFGDSSPFLITIAESESDEKIYTAARQDLERAIALTPDSYPAHYVLGDVLVSSGKLSAGIEEYRTAIRLSPMQPRTYYQLGRALEYQGNNDEAKLWFKKALSLDSRYAPAYCEIGKLQLRSDRLQDAVGTLTRALQYDPALQESYYLLIQAYARLGERDMSRVVENQWAAYKRSHQLRLAPADDNPLMAATMALGPSSNPR